MVPLQELCAKNPRNGTVNGSFLVLNLGNNTVGFGNSSALPNQENILPSNLENPENIKSSRFEPPNLPHPAEEGLSITESRKRRIAPEEEAQDPEWTPGKKGRNGFCSSESRAMKQKQGPLCNKIDHQMRNSSYRSNKVPFSRARGPPPPEHLVSLLNYFGWTVAFQPEQGDYVYVSTTGIAYFSLLKAFETFLHETSKYKERPWAPFVSSDGFGCVDSAEVRDNADAGCPTTGYLSRTPTVAGVNKRMKGTKKKKKNSVIEENIVNKKQLEDLKENCFVAEEEIVKEVITMEKEDHTSVGGCERAQELNDVLISPLMRENEKSKIFVHNDCLVDEIVSMVSNSKLATTNGNFSITDERRTTEVSKNASVGNEMDGPVNLSDSLAFRSFGVDSHTKSTVSKCGASANVTVGVERSAVPKFNSISNLNIFRMSDTENRINSKHSMSVSDQNAQPLVNDGDISDGIYLSEDKNLAYEDKFQKIFSCKISDVSVARQRRSKRMNRKSSQEYDLCDTSIKVDDKTKEDLVCNSNRFNTSKKQPVAERRMITSPEKRKTCRSDAKKRNRNSLVVRRGKKDDCREGKPIDSKAHILSWLIDHGTMNENDKVVYISANGERNFTRGFITRGGIWCNCCKKVVSLAVFEAHSNSKLCKPLDFTFLLSGKSLLECLREAWEKEKQQRKIWFKTVGTGDPDPSDDSCGLCADGGHLLCCDSCPSTFHQECVNLEVLPKGTWYCSFCRCKFCMVADHGSYAASDSPLMLISCKQCRRKYHQECAWANGVRDIDEVPFFFCGKGCWKLSTQLSNMLGIANVIDGGFSWKLLRRIDEEDRAELSGHSGSLAMECNANLSIALSVLNECFVPLVDRRTGIDMLAQALYNCGSNLNRLNYEGFYTAILEKDEEIITVASLRIHGTLMAEMPFVGTRPLYRKQGMCRRLLKAIEDMLSSLHVEKLIIPAIPELLDTWTKSFSFSPLEQSHKDEIRNLSLMIFAETTMLRKPIFTARVNNLKGKHIDASHVGHGSNSIFARQILYAASGDQNEAIAKGLAARSGELEVVPAKEDPIITSHENSEDGRSPPAHYVEKPKFLGSKPHHYLYCSSPDHLFSIMHPEVGG